MQQIKALLFISSFNFLLHFSAAARIFGHQRKTTLQKQCPGKPLMNQICCCKSYSSLLPKDCQGLATNKEMRHWYPAVIADELQSAGTNQTATHTGSLHTCSSQSWCCHMFSGSKCQTKGLVFNRVPYDTEADLALCSQSSDVPQFAPESLLRDHQSPPPPVDIPGLLNTPVFLDTLSKKPNQFQDTKAGKLHGRDYTIIIDLSEGDDEVVVPSKMAKDLGLNPGKQQLSRQKQAEGALAYLAPYVAAEDPYGVRVFLRDNELDGQRICDATGTGSLFRKYDQQKIRLKKDSTDVFKEAMTPDRLGRAETIFVLIDKTPDDHLALKNAIIEQSRKMCDPKMLAISFIQVGSEPGTWGYLQRLDEELQSTAKFDIVDVLTHDEMQGRSFLEVIEDSVFDHIMPDTSATTLAVPKPLERAPTPAPTPTPTPTPAPPKIKQDNLEIKQDNLEIEDEEAEVEDEVDDAELPPGWSEHFNADYQLPYYFHAESGTSSWEKPTA